MLSSYIRVGLAALTGLGLAGCVSLPSAKTDDKADIYLLMGQSNMSGRGIVADIPAGALPADPMITLYGNDGVWRVAQEPLDSSDRQIDAVSSDNKLPGVGPGLAFARALKARQPSRRIALVPCAKGGSALKEWTPDEARTTLYGSCLARAHEAMAMGRIKGVLWYQGETDASSEDQTALWPERMAVLVDRVRIDLKAPCLNWVIVGLSDKPDPLIQTKLVPGWEKIQALQASLPQQIAHLAHVSAVGLPKNPDTLHLSTAAQLRLGQKLAEAMAGLQAKACR
jgi:hypothetical protein